MKKYIVEFIGTFTLSFVVLTAISFSGTLPISIPLIAGLTLGLFVYSIGPISGCHINPSVTLGQLSVKKISSRNALGYIIAQFMGALIAIALAKFFMIESPMIENVFNSKVFVAEMVGAFFFNFGIASVVYGQAKEQMSGLIIGGSLLLGIIIASLGGALGILNPAVALALNSFTLLYILAPIIGAILGFQVYRSVASK